MNVVILILSLGVILAGAELFTNGVEWFGHKMEFAEGVVGSVLAAVGTAMPETLIPVVAILFPASAGEGGRIGIGAILGAPFMLSTLAMFVTFAAVIIFSRLKGRPTAMGINCSVLGRDVRFFLGMYPVAILAGFIPQDFYWVKVLIAAGLILSYGNYVRLHLLEEPELRDLGAMNRLHLARHLDVPHLRIITVQVIVGLALIVAGADFFVSSVREISAAVGVPVVVLSLIIAPIATELPEKFNSVIWVRQNKDVLALGNITGAMVFQGAIPVSIGILFTPWSWLAETGSTLAGISAGIAIISTLVIFVPMMFRGRLSGWWLSIGGLFYAVYLIFLFQRI
jgi:cation:H+ antiporter